MNFSYRAALHDFRNWSVPGKVISSVAAEATSRMNDHDLQEQLGLFDPSGSESVRSVRRPAGAHLLVEFQPKAGIVPRSLAGFWLACLWRLLEDSQQNTEAFEGLAFQALAQRLTSEDFERLYGEVRSHLTLPPPYPLELSSAYRVLDGRLVSFVGLTCEGSAWAGFFQKHVFEV